MLHLRGSRIALLAITLLTGLASSSLSVANEEAHPELNQPFDGTPNYSRTRHVDFTHLRIMCSFNEEEESVTGQVFHFFKALRDDVKTITLDAIDMTFDKVQDGKQRDLEHRVFSDRIEIDLIEPLAADASAIIGLSYKAYPKKGLYFIRPIAEYPDRPRQIWTQGEPHEARHWIPCFDSPDERITSEVIATVPYPLEVLSNGILKQVIERQDSKRTYHWVCEYSHVSYLITMAAGEYQKLEDTWQGIFITSWYYPGDESRAALSFDLTADMMEFFSDRFGRYPYDVYNQIVVRDFIAGGMENTSATTLNDRTLHDEDDEPHTSSQGLVAHELAHQWFGNLITCRDWSHIWLNESFATFCATYYTEAAMGRPEAQMERLSQAKSYLREDARYRRPMVCATYHDPWDVFDSHSYPKGARILEMLRQHLGDATFIRGVRNYLRKHRQQSVVTEQFRVAMEEATGEALGRFFDDWIYKGGHPEVQVRQSYDPKSGSLTLKVQQIQEVDDLTPLHHFPVTIGIYDANGKAEVKAVQVNAQEQTFSFDAKTRPAFVRFDHRSVMLMELDHQKPNAEWIAQLQKDPDTLGRVFAARNLGELLAASPNEEIKQALIDALGAEEFWGVRREIARALAHSSDRASGVALESCLANDADKRVREAAAQSLGSAGHNESAAALESAFGQASSSDWIRAACLESHEKHGGKESIPFALRALEVPSHRERVRKVAVDILENHEHRDALPQLLALAQPGAPRDIRPRAMRAIAKLGSSNEQVRDALIAQLADPHRATRKAVFRALGILGGEAAKKALEARRPLEDREDLRKALDDALATIGNPETVEALSEELKELKKKNEELEDRLRALEESKPK